MPEIETNGFEKRYPAKLLLFGEYAVIHGAKALAIPYNRFYGQWSISETPNQSNITLEKFGKFLAAQESICKFIDVNRLIADVQEGLYFNSSIPEGYGMGSSGALCAGIYDRYVLGGRVTDFGALQGVFRLLESYFHGAGSGFDPLVCYLNRVIVKAGQEIREGQVPQFKDTGGAIFILDTRIPRQTAPLVQLFNEKCLNRDYLNTINNALIPSNNNTIEAYLNVDAALLYESWKQVSLIQYHNFIEMIPSVFREIWLGGTNNEHYCLKLCGAGGGGFLLGITKNYNLTKSVLKDWNMTILHEI